jgi:hypothetical protein
LPLIATLLPFSKGAPDESLQTLPVLSTIWVDVVGMIVPLTEGEPAPPVPLPEELLDEELPDEEPLDEELLDDEDDEAALIPAPGVQVGRFATGAAAVGFHPPPVAAPYCDTYHTYHSQLAVS